MPNKSSPEGQGWTFIGESDGGTEVKTSYDLRITDDKTGKFGPVYRKNIAWDAYNPLQARMLFKITDAPMPDTPLTPLLSMMVVNGTATHG